MFLAIIIADAHHDDLGFSFFFDAQRFFEGDGIEGVDGKLNAGGIEGIPVEPNPGVGIGDAFEGDEDFQRALR